MSFGKSRAVPWKDQGDKKIVNPVAGAKTESTDKLAGIKAAYAKMNS